VIEMLIGKDRDQEQQVERTHARPRRKKILLAARNTPAIMVVVDGEVTIYSASKKRP
jgi:hypothetical protein